jgi:FkbM family methyltransferase
MFTAMRRMGLRNYLAFRACRLRDKAAHRDGLVTLASKEARFPLIARRNTSDLSAFSGVFCRRVYAAVPRFDAGGLIIDCGANVGYSAAYFLTRFPAHPLYAIEPERSNFALLRANLSSYGGAVRVIHSAVWSHAAELVHDDTPYRDGRHWSHHVREARRGEQAAMFAVDIGTLLGESGQRRISLLKMDVEGAEAVVFSSNYEDWIDRVETIAIELHDDSEFGEATSIFHRAIAGRGFAITHAGELTICRRMRPISSATLSGDVRVAEGSGPASRRQHRKSA